MPVEQTTHSKQPTHLLNGRWPNTGHLNGRELGYFHDATSIKTIDDWLAAVPNRTMDSKSEMQRNLDDAYIHANGAFWNLPQEDSSYSIEEESDHNIHLTAADLMDDVGIGALTDTPRTLSRQPSVTQLPARQGDMAALAALLERIDELSEKSRALVDGSADDLSRDAWYAASSHGGDRPIGLRQAEMAVARNETKHAAPAHATNASKPVRTRRKSLSEILSNILPGSTIPAASQAPSLQGQTASALPPSHPQWTSTNGLTKVEPSRADEVAAFGGRRNSLGSLGASESVEEEIVCDHAPAPANATEDDPEQEEEVAEQTTMEIDSMLRNQIRLLQGNIVDTPTTTPSLSPAVKGQRRPKDRVAARDEPREDDQSQLHGGKDASETMRIMFDNVLLGNMSNILPDNIDKDSSVLPVSQIHDDQSILGDLFKSLPKQRPPTLRLRNLKGVSSDVDTLPSPGQYFAKQSGPLGDLEGRVDERMRVSCICVWVGFLVNA
jgi:hypothetical protein